jgi:hypothetical protein
MLPLKTKAQLEELHTSNLKESLHLEYKASPFLPVTLDPTPYVDSA